MANNKPASAPKAAVVVEDTLTAQSSVASVAPADGVANAPSDETPSNDGEIAQYGDGEVATTDDVVVSDTTGEAVVDTKNVEKLKGLLTQFADAVTAPGHTSADYAGAAQLALAVTRLVCTTASRPVLDAFLDFVKASKDDVMSSETMMQGSVTLAKNDAEKVGYLFGLFLDLAHERVMPVVQTNVINVLGSADVYHYYERKMRGIKASKA